MGDCGTAGRAREGWFERDCPAAGVERMLKMTLRERMIDPRSPDRRPRRAAYILPTLFTAGNIFLGYLAILQAFQGAMAAIGGSLGANPHFCGGGEDDRNRGGAGRVGRPHSEIDQHSE